MEIAQGLVAGLHRVCFAASLWEISEAKQCHAAGLAPRPPADEHTFHLYQLHSTPALSGFVRLLIKAQRRVVRRGTCWQWPQLSVQSPSSAKGFSGPCVKTCCENQVRSFIITSLTKLAWIS